MTKLNEKLNLRKLRGFNEIEWGTTMPFSDKFLDNTRDTYKFIYTIRELFTDSVIKFYVRKIMLKIIIIGIMIGTLIFLGIYLNKLFEALLVLVAWLQFELAYRQIKLHKALQEPLLSIEVSKTPQGSYNLSLENVGPMPAYSVNIKGIYDKDGKRISWGFWHQEVKPYYFPCLKPKEKKVIAEISDGFYNEYLIKNEGLIEISYYNQFGEENMLSCSFFIKEMISYAVVNIKKKLSGFFILTLIDDIKEFQDIQNLRKYIKEY